MATSISGLLKNIFFGIYFKRKLCSKFSEDRCKTGLAILSIVAGWTDTGRTLKFIYILSNAIHCIGETITFTSLLCRGGSSPKILGGIAPLLLHHRVHFLRCPKPKKYQLRLGLHLKSVISRVDNSVVHGLDPETCRNEARRA